MDTTTPPDTHRREMAGEDLRCGYCGRGLVLLPNGSLDLAQPVYVNSTACDVRNTGFESGLPHIRKTEWLLNGLNAFQGDDIWQDVIYGLLTAEEWEALRAVRLAENNPECFTHDGMTYVLTSHGVWTVRPSGTAQDPAPKRVRG